MSIPTLNDLKDLILKSSIPKYYFRDVITIILSETDITIQKLIQKSRLPRSLVIKILKTLQLYLQKPTEFVKVKDNSKEIFQKYLHEVKPRSSSKFDWVRLTEEVEGLSSFLSEILQKRAPPKRSLDQFDATLDTLLRRVQFLELEGSLSEAKILFLGDYDLTSLTVAKFGGPKEIHVLDIDRELLNFINNISSQYGFSIVTHQYDLRLGFPDELLSKFDIVFTDPPFTINGAKLFLYHARSALSSNGIIYCCFGYSINDLIMGKEFQKLINELNLVARTILENFNVYSKAQTIGSTSHMFKLIPLKIRKKTPPQITGPIYTGYNEKEDMVQLVGPSMRFKLIQDHLINNLVRELLVGETESIAFLHPSYGHLLNILRQKGIILKFIEPNAIDEDVYPEKKSEGEEILYSPLTLSKRSYQKLVIESPCLDLDLIIDWIQIKSCKIFYIVLPERYQNLKLNSKKIKLSLITKTLLSIFWKWNLISTIPPESFEPRYSKETYLYRVTPLLKERLLPDFSRYVLREVYEQQTKKILNALREGIIRYFQKLGKKFSKKESIQLVRTLNIPNNILNLEITQLSVPELEILIKKLLDKKI
ncbi:MAG: bis-aminopropyl spermidine synthase family protein [Candidatus Helarchaeota archaeon]